MTPLGSPEQALLSLLPAPGLPMPTSPRTEAELGAAGTQGQAKTEPGWKTLLPASLQLLSYSELPRPWASPGHPSLLGLPWHHHPT